MMAKLGTIVLAITLQMLVTVVIGQSQLRVGASDFVMPVFVAVLGYLLFAGTRYRFNMEMPSIGFGLMAFSVVVVAATAIGYLETGDIILWAVVNRGAGWFVLLAYFVLGAWLSFAMGGALKTVFLKATFVFSWMVCVANIVLFVAYLHFSWQPYDTTHFSIHRLQGLFANPNAFGVFVAGLVWMQIMFWRQGKLFGDRWHFVGVSLLGAALVLSGSRAAWLGAIAALIVLVIMRQIPWKKLILSGIGVAGTLAIIVYVPWDRLDDFDEDSWVQSSSISQLYFKRDTQFDIKEGATQYRMETFRLAMDLWERAPVLGAGLGRYLWHREQARTAGEAVPRGATIHSTPLWILTEMGILGLLVFVGLAVQVFRGLWLKSSKSENDPLATGVMAMFVVVAAASLAHDMLYQRYLWLFLGMVLVDMTVSARQSGRS